jgi:hypothetical protein
MYFALALVVDPQTEIVTYSPAYPASLNVLYEKACIDMKRNIGRALWIAAGKGSGKSRVQAALTHKRMITIDSDLYGRVLYQLSTQQRMLRIDSDSKPMLAQYFYDIQMRNDFDDLPSLHEVLADDFIQQHNITIDNLIANKVPFSKFRSFSSLLDTVAYKLLKFQDYCNILGLIPFLPTVPLTLHGSTIVIFCHNTMELFPSMTNAMWLMECPYDLTPILLARERQSTTAAQLFLGLYYQLTEPLMANGIPVSVLVKALNFSIPDK